MTGYSTPVVLASTSEYRKKQLSQLKIPFAVAPPRCDETPTPGEHARDLALRLSHQKALSLAADYPRHLIIGSDQTAALGNTILGKPLTEANAVAQLLMCQGQSVTFYSGVCILDSASGKLVSDVTETTVCFRNLTKQQIETYIRQDQPLYCAGSFKCESLGIALFDSIQSSDPSALIGLPLIALNRGLSELGLETLSGS